MAVLARSSFRGVPSSRYSTHSTHEKKKKAVTGKSVVT